LGRSSGSTMTTGSKNAIVGQFNGNQGGLDIRTSSNNIVLSDGDGNARTLIDSNGVQKINHTSTTALAGNTFGAPIINVDATGQVNANAFGAMNIPANYVGLGCTSDGNVNYFAGYFERYGALVGSISVAGSSTSYNTSSDYRIKENVVYDWDATTRLKQLKPVRFNFIADADTTVDGFLAHEAQAVVPEAVIGTHNEVDDDGNAVIQGIDQSKLVPLLVKTIQELEARITALEGA